MSFKSALLASPETAATMLTLSTTCWGVKAASALWANKKAEKTEAMVENNILQATERVSRSRRQAGKLGQESAEEEPALLYLSTTRENTRSEFELKFSCWASKLTDN